MNDYTEEDRQNDKLRSSLENKLYDIGIKTNTIKQGNATVAGYVRDTKTGEAIIASPAINLPIFMAQGTEDEVTSLPVNQSFFEALKAPSKTFKIYPGMRHELHNETDRIKVLTDYADWLEGL